MKHNWEYKRLGDVCFAKKDIVRANSIYSTNDEISYFDISSIDNQTKQATSYTTIPFGNAPSRAQQVIENGDILYSLVRPNLKNIALLNSNATNKVGTSGFCILRGKDVLPQYILYFVLSIHYTDYILTRATGASYPAVTEEDVRRASIPVPPIDVQKQIVAELDKLNKVIATKREQIKQLDLLAQSIFYDTFGDPVTNPKGWQMVSLKSVCSHIVDCPHSTPKKSSVPTDYPCIRTSELTDSGIDWTTMQYLDETEYQKRVQRLKPQYGDLIYGREGTVGGCVIVPKEKHFSLGQRTMMFRPSTINSVFLLATFRSQWIRNQTERKIVGQTVKHINIKDLIEFTIPNPPIELQQHFAMRIEAIEKQKAQIEESIKELQTLLDSRMDYWFN